MGSDGNGKIYKTTNGGVAWNQVSSIGGLGLSEIYFTTLNEGFCVDMYTGLPYRTIDGGVNWNPVMLEPGNDEAYGLSDIFFIDSQKGWAVGHHGSMMYTLNGGTTWNKYNSNLQYEIRKLYPIDSLSCWAVSKVSSGTSSVISTINGGASWQESSLPLLANNGSEPNYGVSFAGGGQYGWAWDYSRKFWKTNNAGHSWQQIHPLHYGYPHSSPIKNMYIESSSTGWMCSNGYLYKTSDGGLNWNRVSGTYFLFYPEENTSKTQWKDIRVGQKKRNILYR